MPLEATPMPDMFTLLLSQSGLGFLVALILGGKLFTSQNVEAVKELAKTEKERADRADARLDAIVPALNGLSSTIKDLTAAVESSLRTSRIKQRSV